MKFSISPYVFPGLKSSPIAINQPKPYYHKDKNIITLPISGRRLGLSKGARSIMDVDIGDRIKFVKIGEELFICKSKDGSAILKDGRIAYKNAVKQIREKSERIRVIKLIKTKHYFGGERLFKLNIRLHAKHR